MQKESGFMFKINQSKALRLMTLAVILSVGAVAEASAFSRSVSATGPNGGTYTRQGSGGCSGGSCSWNSTATGPNGLTSSHSATATSNGNGAVSINGAGTGPNGRSYNRSVTYGR